MNPVEFLDEYYLAKTRVLELSIGKNFLITTCVILVQYQCQTDVPTMGITGALHSYAVMTCCKTSKILDEILLEE